MIIYQITNIVNQKTYIGKTTKSVDERFYRHKYNSHSNSQTHLHRAMRKHGVDCFIITPLEENVKHLDEREKYWIVKLRPEYNMTVGGEGGDTSSSTNFKEGMKRYHANKKTSDYATYGMLGKSHPQKGKSLKKNWCPVMCEGVRFDSVGHAEKHYKGISIKRRLENPKYPQFYRLRAKTSR
jgi:group I intron endonuclease